MSTSVEKIGFSALDLRQISSALKHTGPCVRHLGNKGELQMYFLHCGLPIFHLLIHALDELEAGMSEEHCSVEIEYDPNEYI